MCRLKSGIILKDQVFVPDYDSHTDMLKELNIKDNEINAKTLFVRAELSPINDNIFSDISTWQFNIDQDILPDWFIYEYDKQRMISVVKEWLKDHVFKNVDKLLELEGNDKYYLKNCKNVEAYDNCEIIAYDNCEINAYDNCTVNAYDNCTVNAYGKCTVNAQNKCTVNAHGKCTVNAQNKCTVNAHGKCIICAYDTCTVKAYDDSAVKAYGNCTVNAYGNCKVYAYFIDKATKTIFFQNEDYKFIKIGKTGERV